jgi:long-subunit acyl-CoA synthetase (AMP-forming)
MMLGYIGDKGELMNPLNNGWFHTLDFAHFDNKFLYVIGRKSLSHYSTWKDKKNDSNN